MFVFVAIFTSLGRTEIYVLASQKNFTVFANKKIDDKRKFKKFYEKKLTKFFPLAV